MKKNTKWVITVTIVAFILTILFSLLSTNVLETVNIYIGILIVFLFILLGIIFDIIGVAVATSSTTPFHAMASRKVKGASSAKKMIENSDKVSSFCNDVIGDVCGVISGSAGIVIAEVLSIKFNISLGITTLVVTALIAALTIGGKAIGKGIAINKSEKIVSSVTKVLNIFKK